MKRILQKSLLDTHRAAGKFAAAAALFLAVLAPVAALSCREADIDGPALLAEFKRIHSNIYNIYGIKEGGEIYDTLAASCRGKELERQVLEYIKCLKVQKEMKTFITIKDVEYNDVRLEDVRDGEAEIFCKWIVIGLVRHPTHIHRKVNLNEAVYRVALGNGKGPRITGYDLLTTQAVEVMRR